MRRHGVETSRERDRVRSRMRSLPASALLWRELEKRQMLGFEFARTCWVERVCVDFYCEALRLAVAVDRIIVNDARALRDEKRHSIRLGRLGICVLRFTDDEVMHNLDGVMASIRRWVRSRPGLWGGCVDAPSSAAKAELAGGAGASTPRRRTTARARR